MAALALACAAVALQASCRDLVTSDVVDAEAALCTTFQSCEIEDAACTRVQDYFATGSDGSFADYLDYYVVWRCAEGCGSIEVCLDHPALCSTNRAACALDFDCCNASTGAASCRDGACCFDLGVVCASKEDCCPLLGGEEVDCFVPEGAPAGTPRTCGGVEPCGLRGAPCVESGDCCGKATCRDQVCEPDTCVERDEPCRGDEKCCTSGDTCQDGACRPPDFCSLPENAQDARCCTVPGDPCRTDGETPCCGGNLCVAPDGVEGLCLPPDECGPPGNACETDEDCCDVGPDPIGCTLVGDVKACKAIDCQLLEGTPCGDNGLNCCTGLTCRPDASGESTCQKPCEPTECGRDALTFGPPLDPRPECAVPGQESCVALVCDADPFCCCAWWDEHCVEDAATCLDGGVPEG